jgi:hypothetical protein
MAISFPCMPFHTKAAFRPIIRQIERRGGIARSDGLRAADLWPRILALLRAAKMWGLAANVNTVFLSQTPARKHPWTWVFL